MAVFWELFQESQINKRKKESGTLEDRVAQLEDALDYVSDVLSKTLAELDKLTNGEFDGQNIAANS